LNILFLKKIKKKTNIVNNNIANNNVSIVKFGDNCKILFSTLKKKVIKKT